MSSTSQHHHRCIMCCCTPSFLLVTISCLLQLHQSSSSFLSSSINNNSHLHVLQLLQQQQQPFPLEQNMIRRLEKTNLKLRNFDLPEALIFYGIDTVIEKEAEGPDDTTLDNFVRLRPGVLRLIKESEEVKTPIIILSEHYTMDEMSSILHAIDETFLDLNKKNILHYRSSLEEFIVDRDKIFPKNSIDDDDDHEDYEYPPTYLGMGIGFAPSPAALVDAINTILIEPRGFGGSAGFGIKYADAVRNPLPQHCVVFVSSSSDIQPNVGLDGSGSISRDRCIASRTAGMRVIYIEDGILGSCTAEDVSDGIVESLGTKNDWSMVTMDDISTPGSFWLNMAQPKDENGNRVNTYVIIDDYKNVRTGAKNKNALEPQERTEEQQQIHGVSGGELDEDEINNILADLDSL